MDGKTLLLVAAATRHRPTCGAPLLSNMVRLATLAVGIALATGCTAPTPGYCIVDQECAPVTELCNPNKKACYTKCKSNADCQDTSKEAFEASKPLCHVQTGRCIPIAPADSGTSDASDGGTDTSSW